MSRLTLPFQISIVKFNVIVIKGHLEIRFPASNIVYDP